MTRHRAPSDPCLIVLQGATNNLICAEFITGIAKLNNPDWEITRWQTTLVAFAVAFTALASNVFIPHLLHKVSYSLGPIDPLPDARKQVSNFFLIWNICSFVIIIVTILAMNDHKQSASFVFKDFQNFTGFGTAYTAILGLLQTGELTR